jgi:hypothetical protein
MGGKNRLKAERAWFLSQRGRRAKSETEHLLPRWGKRCVFLNPKAGAYGFLNTQPDLSLDSILVLSITEIKMLTAYNRIVNSWTFVHVMKLLDCKEKTVEVNSKHFFQSRVNIDLKYFILLWSYNTICSMERINNTVYPGE